MTSAVGWVRALCRGIAIPLVVAPRSYSPPSCPAPASSSTKQRRAHVCFLLDRTGDALSPSIFGARQRLLCSLTPWFSRF